MGPVSGWLVSVTSSRHRSWPTARPLALPTPRPGRSATAVSVLSPTTMPSTTPSRPDPAGANASLTSSPLRVTLTSPGRTLGGRSIAMRASPPLTWVASDDSTSIAVPPLTPPPAAARPGGGFGGAAPASAGNSVAPSISASASAVVRRPVRRPALTATELGMEGALSGRAPHHGGARPSTRCAVSRRRGQDARRRFAAAGRGRPWRATRRAARALAACPSFASAIRARVVPTREPGFEVAHSWCGAAPSGRPGVWTGRGPRRMLAGCTAARAGSPTP
jgi:hypothetical protein